MRTASAAALKHRANPPAPRAPRPGTRLRRLYDVLQASRGLPCRLDAAALGYPRRTDLGSDMRALTDFYGLDIRLLHHNGHPDGRGRAPGTWVLAGEYIGPAYRDYIAQRLQGDPDAL